MFLVIPFFIPKLLKLNLDQQFFVFFVGEREGGRRITLIQSVLYLLFINFACHSQKLWLHNYFLVVLCLHQIVRNLPFFPGMSNFSYFMIIIDAKQRRKVLRVTQYQLLYDYYKNYIDILKIVDFDENADFSKKIWYRSHDKQMF